MHVIQHNTQKVKVHHPHCAERSAVFEASDMCDLDETNFSSKELRDGQTCSVVMLSVTLTAPAVSSCCVYST